MFWNRTTVVTDAARIDELLDRGVANIYPSRDFLKAKLAKGEQVSIYLGIDPTGPTLHIGHAITLMKLKQFQDLGHKVILLIGDFTGMIGDPTDKSATRKQLTRSEVIRNAKLYKSQASTFLSFSGANKAELKYNAAWLGALTMEDIISLMSKMTVTQMLERDMFEKRMKEGRPIYLHEFLYPLLQGYDSVALGVDGEVGGNDQTFNMLAGRNLMKEMQGKEKFVITMKLLADQTGKKMGKTENNMVALTDSPSDMFGKIMSWTDGMIMPGLELCTYLSPQEIESMRKELESGANPRDSKIRLAREVVSIYHGADAAAQAEQAFLHTFAKGGIPEDIETAAAGSEDTLADIMVRQKVVASKSEWRRLVDEGAVTVADTGQKITDPLQKAETATYKVGKRRFIRIEVK